MKICGPRLLVRSEWTPDVTPGGIIIPDAMKEKTQAALVLRVGRGHILRDGSSRPCCAAPGDRILYGKRAGTEVELEGEKLTIIEDGDVVAIIKPGGAV